MPSSIIRKEIAAELSNMVYWRIENLKKNPKSFNELLFKKSLHIGLCLIKNPCADPTSVIGFGKDYYLLLLTGQAPPRYVTHIYTATLRFIMDEMFHPHSELLLKEIDDCVDLMLSRLEARLVQSCVEDAKL